MSNTWRDSTKKTYSSQIKKWITFCLARGIDQYNPHISQVIDFLVSMAQNGSVYSSVNVARCSLSAVLPVEQNQTVGMHQLVGWTVKATNNVNPSQPRYTSFWDVNLVLELFENWGRNKDLTLYRLTVKVNMLLLLLTAQRGQTIWRLCISGLEFFPDKMIFRMRHLLKHNRPGDPLDTLIVPAYNNDKKLCPVSAVKRYLKVTKDSRGHTDQLLISTKSPYGPVSRDTVSRWAKEVLRWSGVNTKRFKAHSTRGAATSKACQLGIDINLLLRQASWKNSQTFGRFYNKTIERADQTLAHLVIDAAKKAKKTKKVHRRK